jgi:hypothetical protein
MNPNNTTIIVSRYNRDTSWTKDLVARGYRVLIYDHGMNASGSPYDLGANKGKEASVYLKYIVDYYDSLSSYNVFLHDEETAFHHAGRIQDRVIEHEGGRQPYFSFNTWRCGNIKNGVWKEMCAFYKRFLLPYIGPMEQYGDWTLGHQCAAQMVVSKAKIRQHPKKMYQDCFKWIMSTDLDIEITGRLFEWTWRIIFNPIRKNK